jgi:hypothetical protein
MHSLEAGAKRIVDGLSDSSLQGGNFYASSEKVLTEPLVDQSHIFANFGDPTYRTQQLLPFRSLQANVVHNCPLNYVAKSRT